MTIYFSPSTGGFYDDAVHGARQVPLPDPDWVRPTRAIADPAWVPVEGEEAPLVEAPDEAAEPPMIMAPNPHCLLPDDAVEISADKHRELMDAQSEGKVISGDAKGRPVAREPAGPDPADLADRARRQRNSLLLGSDWTQLADVPLSEDMRQALRDWRQELRDLPQQDGFPLHITWPTRPA